MNDMESMVKKQTVSEDEEEEEEDENDEENDSVSNGQPATCFQTIETTMTSKSLLEKHQPIVQEAKAILANCKVEMPAQLKKNYACICLFAFLLGTDFAVIIPTLWDRLSIDFEASGAFMGLVLSSYSLSGVVCGLVMGTQ